MRTRWVLSGLVVGLLLSVGGAVAKEGKFFSAQIHYFFSDIDAEGRTIEDQVGSLFDLEDTLGVDTNDGVPSVNLWFHILRRNSILVSYFTSSYDGSTTLGKPLLYGNELYPAGTNVDSHFDFSLARLHYNFRFLNFKVVDMGILVGVDLYQGEGHLTAAGLPDEDNDFNAPFPVVGLNFTAKIPKIHLFIYAEATGTNLDISDVDASVLDAQFRVTWYIADGPFGLTAGYRYLDLDLKVEDEGEGKITQEGFYGGIAIRF
jgi:hypothetical protein